MLKRENILFGCDDARYLFAILNRLKKIISFSTNIITATTTSDMLFISASVKPALMIICFKDKQKFADEQTINIAKQKIPLLHITQNSVEGRLSWPKDSIVFTCPLKSALQGVEFNSLVNSILLLSTSTPAGSRKMTPAEPTIKPASSGEQRDMSRMVLELDQKVDILVKIKQRISNLYSKVEDPVRTELNAIINTIKNCVNDQKLWDDFKLYFVKTNPQFLSSLTENYPSLTEIDLKYCCYLKMNMTNDDIRALLGINIESVRTHKYRLKKKLFLSRDESVRSFLQAVS